MFSSETYNLATAKTIISTVGSIAATAMVIRSVSQDYLPHEFQEYISSGVRNLFSRFSNQLTMVIEEFDGLVNNEVYEAAEIYIGPKISPNTRRLKISKPEKEKTSFNLAMEHNQEVIDVHNGVKFKWIWVCRKVDTKHFYNPRDMNSTMKSEVRSFELTFHRKHKDFVVNSYLPYVINEAKMQKQERKTVKIFTADYENIFHMNDVWTPVNLDHPSTFETLAMDTKQKEMLLKDLEKFVKRKEFYRKVGKAWKRGYLLYGPPGTGKSSLIAAIANYLNFDIYDLELSEMKKNSDLRKLLVATANRSILVVEDIDCSIDFEDRLANRSAPTQPKKTRENREGESKVTLSGLLNFIDGLWSSCGDERIIIFTTNHKEKLDPALLRPGRMDVHINLSYCTPNGFRVLASNYLGFKDHDLFEEIEDLIRTTEVTPAEVAEQLLQGDDDQPDAALRDLIDFFHVKRKEKEDGKAKKAEEESKGKEAKQEEIESKKKVDERDKITADDGLLLM